MAEQGITGDEKSDGLDIVSIGKLYDGPWEKKYWSSSRGKDRHPYPVGYVAHRNNNGNTYEMAIIEGLKGPEFVISSMDGQSCSGQTPDFAWEGFQKKSCVRIKFWRGKRFSCKIDGAELFGFKNPHVFRLLRGLKANAIQLTEPSLPPSSFGNEQSKGTHNHNTPSPETCKSTNLKVNLVKTQGKEKRSKKRKDTHVKPVSEAEHKRGRPQDLMQSDAPDCRQSCEDHNKGIPSRSSDINENNTCVEKGAYNGNITSHLSAAEDRTQLDPSISSEHHEQEKHLSFQEAGNLIGFKDLMLIEEGVNLLKNQESLDVSMFNHTLRFTSSKSVDEKEDPPVQKDSQLLDTVDLYAPDTLDPSLDTAGNPEVEIPNESTLTINEKLTSSQVLVSQKCITASHSKDEPQKSTCTLNDKISSPRVLVSEKCETESQIKDEMVIACGNDDSEKSDSDPAGNEIDNSMMTLLLPRALPLLKTFSRRKNSKKMNLQEEIKRTDQGLKDEPPAKSSEQIQVEKHRGEVHVPDKLPTENFQFEKQNENVLFSGTDMNSAVPGSKDLTTVVPDSFENDQYEVMECFQDGQVQEAFKANQSNLGAVATLDTRTISATGFKHSADTRIRVITEEVGAGNASSMLTVDHVSKKGLPGLTGGDGDVNASFMPICGYSSSDLVAVTCSTTNLSTSDSLLDKRRPANQIHRLQKDRIPTGSNSESCVMATIPPYQDNVLSPKYKVTLVNCEGLSQSSAYSELFEIQGHNDKETKESLCSNKLTKMVSDDEQENIFELVGCYVHPVPISMVMLRTKGNEVYICVLCGYLMEKDKKLFIYKASIKGEKRGSPSFIGHTTIISPTSKNASGRQILLDNSSLQFTPDGKCLVLLNNIKAPYCREGSVDCQCSACTSDPFEKHAVKVVQVKLGYVQVVCKLRTTNDVSSILVCEPSYLVASEEGGRMNLWTMNSSWSASTNQSYLPTSDSMPNCIVEMKRIPNFPDLIVGHSAYGDFFLWDIRRRIILSKFSAPKTSFLPFLPINLFRFPSQPCTKKQVADIMKETQRRSLETDNHASFPVKEDDLSLVLLIPSVSNLDLHDECPYKSSGVSPVGCWSLALLAKSKLVSENTLDPSATVAGASAGYGIIGTCDGSLYIWELSTGTKLGYLSHCRGATVSCLVADDSNSGAFAVAVDGSQVQVYAPRTSANKEHV